MSDAVGPRYGSTMAFAAVALMLAYLIVLALGLAALPGPDAPIADPYFTLMEVLILALAPTLAALMAVLVDYAAPQRRVFARAALAFMVMCAVVTSVVHFAVLTLSRAPAFADMPWLFAFRWPSVAYALDILAWDLFFALSVLCAAFVFAGPGLTRWVRWLFIASGVVAAVGVLGAATGDMQVRNIGIVGYAVLFPVGVGCLGLLWRRAGR